LDSLAERRTRSGTAAHREQVGAGHPAGSAGVAWYQGEQAGLGAASEPGRSPG
jgi:hypothetical protein